MKLALCLPVKRKKAEPPLALNVHRLNRSSAVRTRSRRRLPRHHSLLLVAHEHETHLFSSLGFFTGFDLFFSVNFFDRAFGFLMVRFKKVNNWFYLQRQFGNSLWNFRRKSTKRVSRKFCCATRRIYQYIYLFSPMKSS